MNMNSFDIEFRKLEISEQGKKINGICLSFKDRYSAHLATEAFKDYMTSPSASKSLEFNFSRNIIENNYSLKISLLTPTHSFNVNIQGINSSYVQEIRKSLKFFLYYLIVIGYKELDGFNLIPTDDFHMFKQDIVIDNEVILGSGKYKVDWLSLLSIRGRGGLYNPRLPFRTVRATFTAHGS